MAILRRQWADRLLLAFLVGYYAVSGLGKLVFLRYLIPLLPFLTLLAARVLMAALDSRVNLSRLAGVVALLVIVGYTVLFALTTTLRYAHDSRDEAAEMIKGSYAAGTTIAVTEFANYYPAIDEGRFELVACPQGTHDAYALVDCNADVVILSGMLFWRPYRSPEIFGDQYAGYEALRQGALGYRRVASFQKGFLNKNLYTALDPMFEGYYVSPTIEIYERVRDG